MDMLGQPASACRQNALAGTQIKEVALRGSRCLHRVLHRPAHGGQACRDAGAFKPLPLGRLSRVATATH